MSEFIGKLSPQSCNPIRLGGEPGLSNTDIAHACTLSSDIGYILICIKYSGDKTQFAALHNLMSNRIMQEATKNHWKKSRLPGLLKLAIAEYCNDIIYTDTQRATALMMAQSTWSRVWKSKYNRLLEIMTAYEAGTLHLIRNRLIG